MPVCLSVRMYKRTWVMQQDTTEHHTTWWKSILLALWRISVACCWTRSLLPSSSYSVSLSCITQISPSWIASSSCLCRFCRKQSHSQVTPLHQTPDYCVPTSSAGAQQILMLQHVCLKKRKKKTKKCFFLIIIGWNNCIFFHNIP